MDEPATDATARRCPDCGTPAPTGKHCLDCGQRVQLPPLRARDLATTLWTSVSSLEAPAIRTIIDLLRNPGHVARQWVDGRRTSYVHPVRFLLLTGVIVALTYQPIYALRDHSLTYQVGLAHYTTQFFGLLGFLAVTPIAVLQHAIAHLLGVRRSWLAWWVVGGYCYGFAVLLQLLLNLLYLLLPEQVVHWLYLPEALLPVALLIWASFTFAARPHRLRAALAALISVALLFGTLTAVVAWRNG